MKSEHQSLIESYEGKLPLLVLEEIKEALPASVSKEKVKRILDETLASYTAAKINPRINSCSH